MRGKNRFYSLETHSSKLSGVHLDVLDVSLDLSSELVQVLDDGALDSLCQVGMVVCDDTCLFSLYVEKAKKEMDGSVACLQ